MSERRAGWVARPQGKLLQLQNAACYSDVPPVHVATDHEIGRAVPEVDTREVAQRIPQLRETAFRFQAIHQDLGRKNTRRAVTDGRHVSLGTGHARSLAPRKRVLPLHSPIFSRSSPGHDTRGKGKGC